MTWFCIQIYKRIFFNICRQRPYHVESTGSRPITEVKQRRARLVLGWVTAWEHRVLLANFFFFFFSSFPLFKLIYIFLVCVIFFLFALQVSLSLSLCIERYAYCTAGRTDEYSVEKHLFNLVWSTVLITKMKNLADHSRPYHVENTGSRPITEVKQRRARLVLGWVTAWEHRVLLATFLVLFFPSFFFFLFLSVFFN